MRTSNGVRADDIVYMVAVIKDSGKVAGFRLLSTALEKTVDVSYNKLLTLLRNGYKVSNLCLLKDRIRAFNEHCGLGRYSQLDIRGKLIEPKMSKVALIKGYGNSKSLLVYNNENCNIQLEGEILSPEEQSIYKEQLDLTMNLIPTLKRIHREILLAKMDGLSYKEISEKLAIDENSVKSLLNKARQILKRKLNNINTNKS